MDNIIYETGLKRQNKEITESWDKLNNKLGKPYKNGECYRKAIYQEHKKRNNEGKNEGVKEGFEEVKPRFEDNGSYYTIFSSKRKIKITKDKLRELKELYCAEQHSLTINQICRKLDIPRRDFFVIKTAFDITHDDTPYISEDLENCDVEELVDKTLEKRKEQYFLKLQQKEIDNMKIELAKYRKQDYFYNKVISEMSIPIKPLTFEAKKINSYTEAQLNLADWHTGLKVINYWNKYSLDIQRERIEDLVGKTITYLHRHNVKKLHIMNLGDLLHGLIHVSTRIVAEVDVIQQFRITWQIISDVLETFAKEVEEVYFYSTYGNHSRVSEKKQDALDRENFELLLPDVLRSSLQNIPNIKIKDNEYDDQILVADICGYKVLGVHGDRDKNDKVAQNLSMMLPLQPYKIFTAHTHHKEVLETHKVDVIVSRSLCGVDDFAKDIRSTSRAGQSLYIYNPEGLECTYDITFN